MLVRGAADAEFISNTVRDLIHTLGGGKKNNMKNLPGWVFLVFFRYEEPNKLGVAHPALPLHGVTPGYGRKTEVS